MIQPKLQNLFLLTITVLLINPLKASGQDSLSRELFSRAEQEYYNGNFTAAMHEFGKVLIVDPGNKRAQEYLRKIGYVGPFYNSGRRVRQARDRRDRLVDMSLQVQEYKEKITKLERQRKELMDSLLGMADERQGLWMSKLARELEINVIQQESKMTRARFQELQDRKDQEVNPVVSMYNESARRLKDEMDRQREKLARQQSKMAEDDKTIGELRSKYYQALDMSVKFQDRLSRMDSEYSGREDELRTKYGSLEKMFYVFQEYLKLREESLNQAKDSLLSKEFDLTKSGQDVIDKIDELIDVYGSILYYQENINGHEDLIKEVREDLRTLSNTSY